MQLTISSPVIWLYPEKVDFRKSIDGLSELIHACDLGDVYKEAHSSSKCNLLKFCQLKL